MVGRKGEEWREREREERGGGTKSEVGRERERERGKREERG